jgi:CubicO group peptidase (beta-lactamase class C family)
MRALLAIVAHLALALSAPVLADVPKPIVPDDVAKNVSARVEAGFAPGVVVGIVSPGGQAYFATGVLEIGKPEKVDESTIFEIGSITKAFTGILLADMVKRGEVRLDDPVAKYLPPEAAPPREGDRQITLVDLATQHSGLPRLPQNLQPADANDPYADYTPERLYAFLPHAKLEHPIGSTYAYSNLGVGLLGHALSRAARKDYGTLVRERIATPLGMTVTAIDVVEPAQVTHVAHGHDTQWTKPTPVPPWTWPHSAVAGAGALRSTAREMIRFVAANAGLVETPLADAMRESHRERAEAGSPEMGIGLGWHIRKSGAARIVWHNGGTGGFRTFCGFDPATKTGVVVLANGNAGFDDVGFHLLDANAPLQEAATSLAVPESKLARLDGYYELAPERTIHVTHEGTQLFAQLTGQPRFPVFAKSETRFLYRVVEAELEFEVAGDGPAAQVTLHQGGRDMRAKRVAAEAAPKERVEVEVEPSLLAEYAGKYSLAPNVVLDCAVEAGRLACQLTGQPRFPVYAESPTSFFYKVVDAQLTFTRGAAGKVDAVVLHQGGVTQRAERVTAP